ncbi:MAG: prephenate dehydrogenase/arogenate dehydrogenase family protein [Pirellulales bacterium]
MQPLNFIAIIGVGLIGGSIGLAVRKRGLAKQVVGIGRSPERLAKARELAAIDRGTVNIAEGVHDADLVVVCTPVASIVQRVQEAASAAPPHAVLTDAGSTKRELVAELDNTVNANRSGPRFVGSHPLAGDHRTGCEFARADLFENRVTVITPTSHTSRAATTTVTEFWQALGSRVVEMSPEAHDQALAITSHLPHLVASAMSATTPEEYLPLTAGGWQDTTRLAAADPELWRQIFAANRAAVVEAVERFDVSLAALREALRTGDDRRLLQLLQEAKQVRDALGN